ncbi:ArdC family protein [Rubellimicrobium aerolatum]|uniref:ArdC family protein n=1 Tax=Rubellimicrobium aerolatum TaxID=490979 RepID=A0ABW0SDZ6_9RHOB|nr:zincin-like metallopeptidase domain-containing protein [Rubellimicrobium aerolatum]MBP1806970.1 antirestriction protein ArdC [Rubellimicrobium aerolatum]
MAHTPSKTFDPEREISERIIAALEAGTPPWRKPWTGGTACPLPLRSTGEAYRGINVLMLWLEATEKGYASPFWLTYKQAEALGGQVRKGERSTLVVKYGVVEKEGEDGTEERRPYLKAYRVFNADQIDGLPAEFTREADKPVDLGTRPDESLEAYFARLGATVETSADPRAYYDPARDLIHMPPVSTFHTTQSYYETLGHEAVHYTGGTARLDRLTRCKDRAAYAFEELVAEIGQCLLFATLGLTPSIDQSAAYVAGWLQALREDKKAIFRAASEAQKAVDLIIERCGSVVEHPEEVAA